MKTGYFKSRLRAEPPPGGLPSSFAVITVWNPEGRNISREENEARTERFGKELAARGLTAFSVTGYDPDSSHEEPGYGVVCDEATALELSREWEQEAFYMVEHGWVSLVFCDEEQEKAPLRSWSEMTDG